MRTYSLNQRTYTVGRICDGRCVPSFAARSTHDYCLGCGYDIPRHEYRQHIADQENWHAIHVEAHAVLGVLREISKEMVSEGQYVALPRLHAARQATPQVAGVDSGDSFLHNRVGGLRSVGRLLA